MTFMMGASQQVSGGGADVTPDDVNWSDVIDFPPGPIYTDTQQIKGISTTITLEVEIINGDNYTLEVGVNNSNSYGGTITDVTGGGTFTVDNNQYVTFKLSSSGFGFVEFRVINNSDVNTTLDVIQMALDIFI